MYSSTKITNKKKSGTITGKAAILEPQIQMNIWVASVDATQKGDYVLVLPRKNAPMYQCYTLGMLKDLVCHVWWVLQYLALRPYQGFLIFISYQRCHILNIFL